LPGIGSWLLSSTGWNAAAELAGAADLLQRASAQGVLVPARLRLEQRVQITSGTTRRFAVPVIDLDVSFRELLGGNQGGLSTPSDRPALPSGYVPIAGNGGSGLSLEEGLTAAETQTVARSARSAAPIPTIGDDIQFGDVPVPVDEPGASPPSASADIPTASQALKPTTGQKKKIGVLLSSLRDERHVVSTEQLWANLATARGRDVDMMILGLDGRDEEGVLHFGPLLSSLDRVEANRLIDWFERVEAKATA
jgi:hypothetical protein